MGNPTRYFGAAMTWAGKQLKYWGKSGKYVNFAYNDDGIRTQKNSDGILTNYYYNGSLLIGMTVGSGSSAKILRFSYDASGNAVAVDYSTDNGSTFNTYYLRNAQSDIVKLIDKTGATVVEYRYDSWGKLLSTSGSLASTLGKNNPFRYRGYVYDEETGFYYLQSRYYNPEVGRFISSDVLLSTGQGVLGHNAYAYCGNNPIVREDTNGYDWWHWLIAGAVVAATAVACVVTCGGAAAAITAVTLVSNGFAAATTSATVAAGIFIGTSTALACNTMATVAESGSVEDFMAQGDWLTVASTVSGGVCGGISSYGLCKNQFSDSPQAKVPKEAKKTYNYVRKHNGRPPNGYVGGNKFVNDGRFGGEVLPRTTLYREYDIYPRIRGINRGGERIVIGGDGSGWYTSDHYMTFLRFR